MPRPGVYLDECVDQHLAVRLRRRGFRVVVPVDIGLLSADDPVHLAYAARNDLLLLTYNRRHFQSLHRRYQSEGQTHGGILIVNSRPPDLLEIRVAMALDWIGTFPDHCSQLFRWHHLQQRLIAGERVSGYTEAEVRYALAHEPRA